MFNLGSWQLMTWYNATNSYVCVVMVCCYSVLCLQLYLTPEVIIQNVDSLTVWHRWFCSISSNSSVSLCTAVIPYLPCLIYLKMPSLNSHGDAAQPCLTALCTKLLRLSTLNPPTYSDSHYCIRLLWRVYTHHVPSHACTCAQCRASIYTINIHM